MLSNVRQLFGLAALILLLAIVRGQELHKSELPPVILIPGLGGSPLEARGESELFRSSNWSTIWVNYFKFVPGQLPKLARILDLDIDPINGSSKNYPGVEIRVKNEDKVRSVEYLTDHKLAGYEYFGSMVNYLVRELGYVRDVNLRGAPYDFRLAPNELGEFYEKLKRKIELMRVELGLPVTIICHSMGCLNSLYFLNKRSDEWKKRNIQRLITLAAPWGGAARALRSHAVDFDMDNSRFSRLVSTFPSTYLLFPNPQVYGNKIVAILNRRDNTPGKLYTARDLESYLEMSTIPIAVTLWKKISTLMGKLEAPHVETHCFYGYGFDTADYYRLKGPDPLVVQEKVTKEGDGSVPVLSARYCETWTLEQDEDIVVKKFKQNHMNMVISKEVIKSVAEVLKKDVKKIHKTTSLPILRHVNVKELRSSLTMKN